jgi:hypothetical protein
MPIPPAGGYQTVKVGVKVHVITNNGNFVIDGYLVDNDYDNSLEQIQFVWDSAHPCSNVVWAVGYQRDWILVNNKAHPLPHTIAQPNVCTLPLPAHPGC